MIISVLIYFKQDTQDSCTTLCGIVQLPFRLLGSSSLTFTETLWSWGAQIWRLTLNNLIEAYAIVHF